MSYGSTAKRKLYRGPVEHAGGGRGCYGSTARRKLYRDRVDPVEHAGGGGELEEEQHSSTSMVTTRGRPADTVQAAV